MNPKAVYQLSDGTYNLIYGAPERAEFASLVEIVDESRLAEAEVILTGWGAPTLDAAYLAKVPNLKLVLYSAGSVRGIVSDEFWARGISISSAWVANGVPVAEFTVATIILSLKQFWQQAANVRAKRDYSGKLNVPGAFGTTVGLGSLGVIGRMVRERLRMLDVKVIAYDPYVTQTEADKLDVRLVTLDELFQQSDVVSLHTPWLKETEGLVTGQHFAAMKTGATFINTSRGAVVREPELVTALHQRPDLWAILDVTWPEPPPPDSPLYTLPNVIVTPHIAGSMDGECRRMAQYMIGELRRYLAGQPLQYQITREKAAIMA